MSKRGYDKVEPEDFIVRIRPTQDSDGVWNGEIDVAIITQPENSLDEHEFILSVEEELLQELEIPYRVVDVCAGDLGASASKK